MHEVTINYLAVLIAGIIAMPIGAVWYGPLFGKQWMKEHGFTAEELKKNFNPAKIYSIAAVSHIIIAYTLARLMGYLDAYSVSGFLHVAFFSWLGFLFLPMFINSLFARKTLKLLFIESLYFLVYFLVAAFLISIWR
jgi:hypothetical protein